MAFGLTACSEGGEGFAFLDQTVAKQSLEVPREDVSLPKAEMMRGQMVLVPPDGYCIDKRSLKQNFAILARCDSLGGKNTSFEAPIGFMSVALMRSDAPVDLPATLTGLQGEGIEVLEQRDTETLALRQLRGGTPEGTDPVHWRGLSRIGPVLISMAAYAPETGRMTGPEGARALTSLVARSRDASRAQNESISGADTTTDGTAPKKGLGGLLSGLFD